MSPLFFAQGSIGVKSLSSPISAIQSAPAAMRYAPFFRPSAFTGDCALAPMNTFTALPEGCVTMGSRAPLIFSICMRNSCAATRCMRVGWSLMMISARGWPFSTRTG
jgi:hypothetical protein